MSFLSGLLSTFTFLVLAAALLLNTGLAAGLAFRKNQNKRADYFFATLLLAYAATCLHHVFILRGVYTAHPVLLFLPVYLTLAFGTLLFFSVKLRLFPTYHFTTSDLKHFVLPVSQFGYFLLIFLLTEPVWRQELGRRFYSPFYGGLEMALYIATFYVYQFAAYRFIRFKINALKKEKQGGQTLYEALVLRRMLRVLLVLFWVNSAYIVVDFVMYELLTLNMHDFRGFTRFGELSFAAIAGWVGLSGVQLLMRPPYLNVSTVVFLWVKRWVRSSH